MKTSEHIAHLQALMEEYGNVDVVLYDNSHDKVIRDFSTQYNDDEGPAVRILFAMYGQKEVVLMSFGS